MTEDERRGFRQLQKARRRWKKLGERNELYPEECFSNELAEPEQFFDNISSENRSGERAIGPKSSGLESLVASRCAGWQRMPTGQELYDAFRARTPTSRELALLDTWFVEATEVQMQNAWAQRAYTDRQLVRAIHSAGYGKTDIPRLAKRIRIINTWAIRPPNGET